MIEQLECQQWKCNQHQISIIEIHDSIYLKTRFVRIKLTELTSRFQLIW